MQGAPQNKKIRLQEAQKNNQIKPQAHSDYINKLPKTYGKKVDIMVEAKAKELSIMKYL